MASASNAGRLLRLACQRASLVNQGPGRVPLARTKVALAHRCLSTTTARRADDTDKAPETTSSLKSMMEEEFLKSATPETLQYLDAFAKGNGHESVDKLLQAQLKRKSNNRALTEEIKSVVQGPRKNIQSFWFDPDGADPLIESHTEEHDEFNEDDITSMAHGKLDEVREMRHYARLAVWEMPLLSKFAKPFVPPSKDHVLRWRYTTYMGESHPAEKKVVVQFSPDDLGLTPVQAEKLKKLAGPRYNPETHVIKISCESYEHQAQNKRYLSNLVDDLIAAAKDPKDTFEDIPLDVRHHEFKVKPKFPKHWRMSEKRQAQLNEYRAKLLATDLEKETNGKLVNGQLLIDQNLTKALLAAQAKQEEKVPELVAARPAKSGKASRRL
ncbi:xylose isomerase [Stachybotrys elegans]|uniref:Xylose isomerase n=1 Tax=Stachybotrys elegans TaxID=80388 RepID=A0A8K0WW14_9HYPO|nr:xylose isomerase [Stachybotrys elegans]